MQSDGGRRPLEQLYDVNNQTNKTNKNHDRDLNTPWANGPANLNAPRIPPGQLTNSKSDGARHRLAEETKRYSSSGPVLIFASGTVPGRSRSGSYTNSQRGHYILFAFSDELQVSFLKDGFLPHLKGETTAIFLSACSGKLQVSSPEGCFSTT